MENPIVWALIATLGTWAVTAAGAADGVPVPQAVAGGDEPHAGLLGRSHDRGELLVPAAARHCPRGRAGRACRRGSSPHWAFCLEPSSSGHLTAWSHVSAADLRGVTGRTVSVLLILAITLHNIPEGLAVGVAFGALQARRVCRRRSWVQSALHSASACRIFRRALRSLCRFGARARGGFAAFWLGQASGLVEPVAGVLGALLVGSVEAILPYALAFAAGAMILVAVHELIPECQRNREARPYTATMGIVAGFAIMMLLDVALG